jgi:hypothetical protein
VAPKRKVAAPGAIEPGLHLVIGAGSRLLRSAPIRNAPRRVLQPPFLVPGILKEITTRTSPLAQLSELVLDVLSRDGRVLDSFGWPWTGEAFYDGPLSPAMAQQGIRLGRIVSQQEELRVLRVPVPADAAFLLFSRSAVDFDPVSRPLLIRGGLALYSLVSPMPPVPRLPIAADNLLPEPLPVRAPLAGPH